MVHSPGFVIGTIVTFCLLKKENYKRVRRDSFEVTKASFKLKICFVDTIVRPLSLKYDPKWSEQNLISPMHIAFLWCFLQVYKPPARKDPLDCLQFFYLSLVLNLIIFFPLQDLVKSHLMNAVRSEVEELKEKIIKLEETINQQQIELTTSSSNFNREVGKLQAENQFLRNHVGSDVINQLSNLEFYDPVNQATQQQQQNQVQNIQDSQSIQVSFLFLLSLKCMFPDLWNTW